MPSTTPSTPPAPESMTGSTRNWTTMSRRRAPRARRMPISRVRSVTRGQHDVHDADAADQQRDGGDGAEHDVEDLLGALGALEQLQRHDRSRSPSSCGCAPCTLLDGLGHARSPARGSATLTVTSCNCTRSASKLPLRALDQHLAVARLGGFQRDEHPGARRLWRRAWAVVGLRALRRAAP